MKKLPSNRAAVAAHTSSAVKATGDERARAAASSPAQPQERSSGTADKVDTGHAARAAAVVRGEVAAGARIDTGVAAEPVAHLRSREEVRQLVDGLVARSFPELRGLELSIEARDLGADTFRSTVNYGSLLFGPRRYVIQVNPEIFDKQMPRTAAEAILAHELCHTVDYTDRSALGMIGLGISYASPRATAAYERSIDRAAIARGYGEGLRAFRRWQTEHLPPDVLAKKQRIYLTEPEIAAVERELQE